MNLTAENVYATFFDSLALEATSGSTIRVRALMNEYVFDAARLEGHREAVRGFLGRVSTLFYADRGGGHTFLALGTRRDGIRWGDVYDSERLVALGLGLGLAEFCLKRRRWKLFPESMPYLTLKSDLFRVWATFQRRDPTDVVELSFDPDTHPPPPDVVDTTWYAPGSFLVSDLSNSTRRHVAEAFYISVVVDGFFEDALPSWILDPDTILQVY